jgi:intracellular septation protein
MNPVIKFITEVAPLLTFFLTFKFYGMIVATCSIVVLSLVSIAITYYYQRKVPIVTLFITLMIVVLGSITILTGNSTFIKIKPTIINILFATIIIGGLIFKKIFLKLALGSSINLSDEDWKIFSLRWAYFFLFLAIFNEVIWRNFSDDVWVKFKVFGILGFTIIFLICNRKFLSQDKNS